MTSPAPERRRRVRRPVVVPHHPQLDWPGWVLFVAVAVGLAAFEQYLHVITVDTEATPANWGTLSGVLLGLLLVVPFRRWGWVVAAAAVAQAGGDLLRDVDLATTAWWTAGRLAGPLAGALALRRFGNPTGLLAPLRQFTRFGVWGVLAGAVVGGTLFAAGTLSTGTTFDANGATWTSAVVSEGLSLLVIAPLFVCWQEPAIRRPRWELGAYAVVLVAVTSGGFRGWDWLTGAGLPYIVLPLLMFGALRHGVRGAALSSFVVVRIANWTVLTGNSPFWVPGVSDSGQLVRIEVFLVVAALSTFVFAALVEDLVDRAELERRLEQLAYTDALTELPNRYRLTTELEQRLTTLLPERPTTVLLCDLDDFKVLNDGLGHHAGDEVLVVLGERMRRTVRPDDLVVRMGGDEFVVLLDGDADVARQIAERLIATVSTPIRLGGGTSVTVSVSIGIASAGPTSDAGSLLRDADAAMYRAKELGRNRFHAFDDQLRTRVLERLRIQTDLPEALRSEQLFCEFQPEIRLADGHLDAFEALVRWNHPELGLVGPDRFVPVVEDLGETDRLFDRVLDLSLQAQEGWAEHLGHRPTVAVNLSARQLGDPEFPVRLAAMLERHRADPAALCLEVTESAVAEGAALEVVRRIHDLGVRLAIDDFGTGWSSMARLADFPWDLLKIDRRFVADLDEPGTSSEPLVASTIAMAHTLGMVTVAEGVETPRQLTRLRELGCDVAQGWLFARPTDADAALDHVTAAGRWVGPGVTELEPHLDRPGVTELEPHLDR